MATWRELITETAERVGDKFEDLTISIDEGELDREFDDDYGSSEGSAFTAWSKDFVYFPLVYDGSEWVGCVPRNPCDIKSEHQGGQ